MAIPFVTGIMSDDLPEDPTPEELARHLAPALEARGFPLDGVPNGIWGGDGMYRIVPASTYADRPWHVARHACPFVGALRGYLEWEHWWGPRHIELDYHYSLALAIFEAARGTTVRLDDGRTKEAVRLREIPLGAALSKTGFDDGNALLYRDESDAYRAHVKDAIQRALEKEGLGAEIGFCVGGDNPYGLEDIQYAGESKVWPLLWRGEHTRENFVDESILWRCPTPALVWTFDFAALRDVDFWMVERAS